MIFKRDQKPKPLFLCGTGSGSWPERGASTVYYKTHTQTHTIDTRCPLVRDPPFRRIIYFFLDATVRFFRKGTPLPK